MPRPISINMPTSGTNQKGAKMPEETRKASVKAIKEFFGYRPGKETLSDFAQELKELSDEEKLQLSDGIENGSLTY